MPEDAKNITINLVQLGETKEVDVPDGTTLGGLIDSALGEAASGVDAKTSTGSSDPGTKLSNGEQVSVAPKQVKHG